ncbi:MAG TPA: PAS domain S-box protein, partial [Anaerolineae bacterium]|nr:PAS domain S-box protein [Anaerolineae bacterium]
MQDNQQTLLHSLEDMTAVVQGMQAGRLRTRLPEPAGPAPLIALTRALNQLAETLQQREAERRQMEDRFQAIFENAAIGISLIAPDGGVLAVNPALQEISGRSEAELIALGGQSIT